MKKKSGKKKCVGLAVVGAIIAGLWSLPVMAEAQTVQPPTTLTWNAYIPPADFRDIEVRRGTLDCAAPGPLPPLILNGSTAKILKPASGPFPTSFVDPTTPQIDGTVCYELTAFDTAGNFATSNRASKVLNLNPPPAVQGLQVQ